ncbi:FAD-dependent oxidoreductase, partial [Candidatus Moduliflexota bacterium]
VMTKEFTGEGSVARARCVKVEWKGEKGACRPQEVPGTEIEIEADLVLLSMGFVHPEHGPLVGDLPLETSDRGNLVVTDDLAATAPMVFAAGDCAMGASLVVRCISQGRRAAASAIRLLR